MKRIIAAALSILVGAFGYTIVDSVMEDRVATLESEVVELREEVSRYHYPNTTSEKSTSQNSSAYSSTSPSLPASFQVGQKLKESPSTMSKFLLRKYSNGIIRYISPQNYEKPQSSSNYALRNIETTTEFNPVDPTDSRVTTFPITITTTTYEDYFLYITETHAQITAIEKEPYISYGYDKNYSEVSKLYNNTKTTVTVLYKGYTNPALAGKSIDFDTSIYYIETWDAHSSSQSENMINSDGSFCFEKQYVYNNAYLSPETFGDIPSFSTKYITIT